MRNEILNGAKTRAKVPRTNQGQDIHTDGSSQPGIMSLNWGCLHPLFWKPSFKRWTLSSAPEMMNVALWITATLYSADIQYMEWEHVQESEHGLGGGTFNYYSSPFFEQHEVIIINKLSLLSVQNIMSKMVTWNLKWEEAKIKQLRGEPLHPL